jgi:amino acid adenylation domain-containing protein
MQAFLHATGTTPWKEAIIHNGRKIPYSEVASTAAHVARVTSSFGERHSCIAVPAVHSWHTVAAFLAVVGSRRQYCPIDPYFPVERQADMAHRAHCDFALSTPAGALTLETVRKVSIEEPYDASEGTVWPDLPRPDDIAYVLFTSGSSGKPKSVEVSHRALSAASRSLGDFLGIEPSDRLLQFASLNWDTCFEEIVVALTHGATLVIDDDAHTGSFPRFLAMLECRGVTVLNLPTAFWHELVGHLEDSGDSLPPTLRAVVIGGEQPDPTKLAAWKCAGTEGVRLVNTYGCTETTLVTHAIDLFGPAAVANVGDAIPIGVPMPHVLQRLEPFEPGEESRTELLIGGPSLATGYRDDPELTSARFVGSASGARYFRTGDLVAEGVDGALRILGREDRQLKVRGIRLDPGEVEAEISRHPDVAATAVVGVWLAGRTALVAYVVGREPDSASSLGDRIADDLRSRLPAHLVPSRFIVVDELPKSSNGKIDHLALAAHHGRNA